jgi:hypothetical protein
MLDDPNRQIIVDSKQEALKEKQDAGRITGG